MNGDIIDRETFLKNLQNTGRVEKISDEYKRNLLNRMIDEKLLLNIALDEKIYEHDSSARSYLTRAAIQRIVTRESARPITEDELRNFYEENQGFFTPNARASLGILQFSYAERNKEKALEAANRALARLRTGANIKALQNDFSAEPVFSYPGGMLPLFKIQEYLGPSLTTLVKGTEDGQIIGPLNSNSTWLVIKIYRVIKAPAPPFYSIRESVRSEFKKRRSDEALNKELQWYRKRARITIAEEL